MVDQKPIILHDNAAAVTDFFRLWQRDILEHPPCSPDASPCDYDLFAKVKEPLRGPSTTQERNLSVLWDDQYGTSTKMDALMVNDPFQTFDKRW